MRHAISHIVNAKVSGAVSLIAAGVLFLLVFIIDAVNKNLEIDLGLITQLRNVFVIGSFFGVFLFTQSLLPKQQMNPLRLFSIILVTVLTLLAIYLIVALIPIQGFEPAERTLKPIDYLTIFFASVTSIVTGGAAVVLLHTIGRLILIKQRKGTRRNFIIFLCVLFALVISTWNLDPLENRTISHVLFVLAIIAGIANSFKFAWLLYLTKREKLYSIGYSFLLFILLIIVNIALNETGFVNRSLLYYSYPLQSFVRVVALFSVIYFGMSFVVSLFHLPTAEAFDRKRIELSSVHNLSRLITRVFDFKDLAETVTNLTIEVTEARSAWLEVLRHGDKSGNRFDVVAYKNIDPVEIDLICEDAAGLRRYILETKKVVVIDEFTRDRRTKQLSSSVRNIGSLIGVPLLSQNEMIGILYASKNLEFGFDQEEIDLISTFADHVTIAIENSRLIEQSIEQERLRQELMVAQSVQRKLLPQQLPHVKGFDLDAFSAPAFEVGGDYYDIALLPSDKIGIVVGDVSGKGVSAAFYMAELKGIFQALSRSCQSTREFLIRTNNALYGTIDKSAFVSLIYAIVDVNTGEMSLSRAGHCPVIHVHEGKAQLLKPSGIGLGLTGSALFDEVIEEERIALHHGDLCIFYTDGITEARDSNGEEFGTERLVALITESRTCDAKTIRQVVLDEVSEFTGDHSFEDDLTIVILKRN